MNRKEIFEKYEQVRLSGLFNMITEATYAMAAAGLSEDEYFYVIKNYSELKSIYGK